MLTPIEIKSTVVYDGFDVLFHKRSLFERVIDKVLGANSMKQLSFIPEDVWQQYRYDTHSERSPNLIRTSIEFAISKGDEYTTCLSILLSDR